MFGAIGWGSLAGSEKKGQWNMHMGMHESRAGQVVGYWRGGRPIYVPAGGSVDAGTDPQTQPPGTIAITPPPPPPAPPRVVSTEELQGMQRQWEEQSQQALREQEERLRAQFQEQLTPLQQAEAERQRVIQEAQDAAAEAERQRQLAEETAAQRAERIAQETQEQLAAMREEVERRDALLEREQRRTDVERYRGEQLAAHANDIHPSQVRWVQGFTREDIDRSIQGAVESSRELLEEVAGIVQQQQGAVAALQRAQPTTSITAPAAGPLEAAVPGATQNLTAQQIRSMSDAEFAANREQLLGAASAAYRSANGYQ